MHPCHLNIHDRSILQEAKVNIALSLLPDWEPFVPVHLPSVDSTSHLTPNNVHKASNGADGDGALCGDVSLSSLFYHLVSYGVSERRKI